MPDKMTWGNQPSCPAFRLSRRLHKIKHTAAFGIRPEAGSGRSGIRHDAKYSRRTRDTLNIIINNGV